MTDDGRRALAEARRAAARRREPIERARYAAAARRHEDARRRGAADRRRNWELRVKSAVRDLLARELPAALEYLLARREVRP
jgi:hypothetical protein